MKNVLFLAATALLVACGSSSESTSDAASPVVVEHSPDDRRKAIVMAVGSPADRIVYCEIPFEQTSSSCSLVDSIAMTIATYRVRLGAGLDRLFPQYAADVAAAKSKLDLANAALAPLQAASADVANRLNARQAEISAAASPLIDQENQKNDALTALAARYGALVDEIARVQDRLRDPSLSPNDHDVLTAKLTQLTTERDADQVQMNALADQIAALGTQIDTILHHDAQLTQLQADLSAAQDRVFDAETRITQATKDLGAAAGRRDDKIGAAFDMAAGPSLRVTDFGDDASRLLFDPFRAPSAPFATGDSCKLSVMHYITYGTFVDETYADPGSIFPAEGALTATPGLTQSLEFFEDQEFSGAPLSLDPSVGLRATWPALAAVAVPTGTFTCQARQFDL